MATDMGGFAQAGGPILVDRFGRPLNASAALNYRRDNLTTTGVGLSKILLAAPAAQGTLRITKNGTLLSPPSYTINSPVSVTLASTISTTDVICVEYWSAYPTAASVIYGSSYNPSVLWASGERGAWLDPGQLSSLWQDTAATTPVTAAGQSVARIDDLSGNGNHFIQPTSGNRPTYSVDGSGFPYLQFSQASSQFMYVNNVNNLLSLGTTSCTFLAAVKWDSFPPYHALFARSYLGGKPGRWYILDYVGIESGLDCDGTTVVANDYAFSDTTSPHIIQSTFDRSGVTVGNKVDGVAGGTQSGTFGANTTNLDFSGGALLGAYNDSSATVNGIASGYNFDGRVYGVIIRIAAIDTTKNAAAQTWLGGRVGLSI